MQVRDDHANLRLGAWLRSGRVQRKLSLDEVARITKIQLRILEKIEGGQLEGLPADVFVRGFVRSFARCVGLSETEALERLSDVTSGVPSVAVGAAKAIVQTMAALAPDTARTLTTVKVIEPAILTEAVVETVSDAVTVTVTDTVTETVTVTPQVADAIASGSGRKKRRGRKRAQGTTPPPKARRQSAKKIDAPFQILAEGTTRLEQLDAEEPSVAIEVVDAPVIEVVDAEVVAAMSVAIEVVEAPSEPWTPKMPPAETKPSVPWRRPAVQRTVAPTGPTLVIDDADPDLAEREQSRREADKGQRVSFLPAILLDREDRSQRQGGLTLAVIILLIAATLTLSYLMRRPAVSGDGVTMAETPTTLA